MASIAASGIPQRGHSHGGGQGGVHWALGGVDGAELGQARAGASSEGGRWCEGHDVWKVE